MSIKNLPFPPRLIGIQTACSACDHCVFACFRLQIDPPPFRLVDVDVPSHQRPHPQGHQRRGIDLQDFGELLMTSGLVLLPNVTWLSFHSGYDFGYLVKLLTSTPLPAQVLMLLQYIHAYRTED